MSFKTILVLGAFSAAALYYYENNTKWNKNIPGLPVHIKGLPAKVQPHNKWFPKNPPSDSIFYRLDPTEGVKNPTCHVPVACNQWICAAQWKYLLPNGNCSDDQYGNGQQYTCCQCKQGPWGKQC